MDDVLLFKRKNLPEAQSFGIFNITSEILDKDKIIIPNTNTNRILIIYANESLVDIYVNDDYYDELNGTITMLIKSGTNITLECKNYTNVKYTLVSI
jgi:hypothetical protein